MSSIWYPIVLAVIIATIAYVFYNFYRVKQMPEGTPRMVEMSTVANTLVSVFRNFTLIR